ncbi:hypothetical protein BVI434_420051 [Burkholderia vietnamiensis]|nr:hypothetical protein BVI434_420051 [Burkholderia vietnamiensis]
MRGSRPTISWRSTTDCWACVEVHRYYWLCRVVRESRLVAPLLRADEGLAEEVIRSLVNHIRHEGPIAKPSHGHPLLLPERIACGDEETVALRVF